MTQAMERMLDARSKLCMMRKTAFYGVCAMSLALVETRRVPTAAVDGKNMFYNPDFLATLSPKQVLYLFCHETRHVTDCHHTRRSWRDPFKWNVAGDFRINNDLEELVRDGTLERIDGALIDAQYGDMAVEDIYAARDVTDQPQAGDDDDSTEGGGGNPKVGDDGDDYSQLDDYTDDPGHCGGVIDATGDEAEVAAEQRKWQAIAREAVSVATKMDGAVPADLKHLAGDLEKPRVDWREVLRAIVDPASQLEFSWMQPDRRFAGQPFVLPGLMKEGVNHVVIGYDTSGSMASRRAQTCLQTECQALMDEGIVDKFTIVYCDTSVRRVDTFDAGEPLVFHPVGGGGTDFVPVFEWVEKNAWDASAIVYFTDMMGSFPTYGPDVPTLWAAYGDSRYHKAPFGEVVMIDY